MKVGLLIGGLVIVICTMIAGMALSGASRKAIRYAEARRSAEPCQIYGEIDKSQTKYDFRTAHLTFAMKELDAKGNPTGEVMPVLYTKVKPASFDEAKHVMASGVFKGNEFHAEQLLVKCPSKYQGKDAAPEVARKAYATEKQSAGR
jgi:cytochrome c-type biogenesis protein CcmE